MRIPGENTATFDEVIFSQKKRWVIFLDGKNVCLFAGGYTSILECMKFAQGVIACFKHVCVGVLALGTRDPCLVVYITTQDQRKHGKPIGRVQRKCWVARIVCLCVYPP